MSPTRNAAKALATIASLSFVTKSILSQCARGAKYRHAGGPSFGKRRKNNKAETIARSGDEIPALEFVHIPKTGGTSILFAAADAGIAWGHCKFSRLEGCSSLSRYADVRIEDRAEWACDMTTNATTVDPWHCPSNRFRSGDGLYDGSSTFTIVRNPYDRIVSEYYWAHSWYRPGRTVNRPRTMNAWVQRMLEQVEASGVCPFGHCIPMHKYTHDQQTGEPIVDHVLRLENITAELPILLERYGLLGRIRIGHDNERRTSDELDASYLTNETIRRINRWAMLDFEYFGYDMIVPSNDTSG
mmetsp:Transcript_31048/g.66080  ORF Transcript_31048/g.66080 Transcript_31048/m.66080 type:complete len:300 (-) Transcript_31048:96-995(-)